MERCAVALEAAGIESEEEFEFDPQQIEDQWSEAENTLVCEHCGSESLTLLTEIAKPSWKEVFDFRSEASPQWYRESLELEERRLWDAAMGEGFSDWYDWYLKREAEGARECVEEPAHPPPEQLWLAGMENSGTPSALSL